MRLIARVLFFAAMLLMASVPASANDLTGEWRGESSGNSVTITMRDGGFAVAFAQSQQSGQADGTFFYQQTGAGTYRYTFPSGGWSTAEEQGPDALRITNSDGWTDLFRRAQAAKPVAARTAAAQPVPTFSQLDRICDLELEALPIGSSYADISATGDACMKRPHLAQTDADAPVLEYNKCMNLQRFARDMGQPGEPCEAPRPTASVVADTRMVSAIQSGPAVAPSSSSSREIAGNGRSAGDCVSLVVLAAGDSNASGLGNRVLANQCSDKVEVVWCYTGGECERDSGSMWTIQPGNSWPVSATKELRWGACHGANTASFEKGTAGLRVICKAPLVKSRR